jgi:hypothetical protein
VVIRTYHNKHFKSEKVYNDLIDMMSILNRLGVTEDISGRVTHVHSTGYKLTLMLVASSFTRTANEKLYEEETVHYL